MEHRAFESPLAKRPQTGGHHPAGGDHDDREERQIPVADHADTDGHHEGSRGQRRRHIDQDDRAQPGGGAGAHATPDVWFPARNMSTALTRRLTSVSSANPSFTK